MAVAMGVTAAAVAGTVPKEAPKSRAEATHSRSEFQIGKASWYGGKFNGRRTASGEKFNQNALTCAHRSLPLGSWVRVTNLANMKEVLLRVNDRGPVPHSRLLDMSYAAARKLGILGLARVKVEPVRPEALRMTDNRLLAGLELPPMPQPLIMGSGVPVLPMEIAGR